MDARKDYDVVAGHGVARRIWRCAAPMEANFCVAADCGGCDVNRRMALTIHMLEYLDLL